VIGFIQMHFIAKRQFDSSSGATHRLSARTTTSLNRLEPMSTGIGDASSAGPAPL
jgi:hypothetical protein